MARSKDPKELLKRRLDSAPRDLWEILEAATRGTGWSKQFTYWHDAIAFRMRFHRFRQDAIEAGVPGALELREVMVSGRDASGETLKSQHQGTPPYLLAFVYTGVPLPNLEQGNPQPSPAPKQVELPPPSAYQDEKVGEDEHDAMLRKIFDLPDLSDNKPK